MPDTTTPPNPPVPPAIIEPAASAPSAPPPTPSQPDALATLKRDLDQTHQTLAALKRERNITRALFTEGVNDLDVGAAMLERDLAAKPDADIPALVRDLKQRKPQLFRRVAEAPRVATPAPQLPASRPSHTMSPRPTAPDSPRDRAAAAAAATNSRPSLLAYMRLRRASAG